MPKDWVAAIAEARQTGVDLTTEMSYPGPHFWQDVKPKRRGDNPGRYFWQPRRSLA